MYSVPVPKKTHITGTEFDIFIRQMFFFFALEPLPPHTHNHRRTHRYALRNPWEPPGGHSNKVKGTTSVTNAAGPLPSGSCGRGGITQASLGPALLGLQAGWGGKSLQIGLGRSRSEFSSSASYQPGGPWPVTDPLPVKRGPGQMRRLPDCCWESQRDDGGTGCNWGAKCCPM